jgi:hypothetical protein
MAMGTRRKRQRQEELWYRRDLAEAPGHPFYRRLNEVLDQAGFDEFCEARCHKFYHEKLGRPSLAPGMYFRVMLIGFFEGIDSERGDLPPKSVHLRIRQTSDSPSAVGAGMGEREGEGTAFESLPPRSAMQKPTTCAAANCFGVL